MLQKTLRSLSKDLKSRKGSKRRNSGKSHQFSQKSKRRNSRQLRPFPGHPKQPLAPKVRFRFLDYSYGQMRDKKSSLKDMASSRGYSERFESMMKEGASPTFNNTVERGMGAGGDWVPQKSPEFVKSAIIAKNGQSGRRGSLSQQRMAQGRPGRRASLAVGGFGARTPEIRRGSVGANLAGNNSYLRQKFPNERRQSMQVVQRSYEGLRNSLNSQKSQKIDFFGKPRNLESRPDLRGLGSSQDTESVEEYDRDRHNLEKYLKINKISPKISTRFLSTKDQKITIEDIEENPKGYDGVLRSNDPITLFQNFEKNKMIQKGSHPALATKNSFNVVFRTENHLTGVTGPTQTDQDALEYSVDKGQNLDNFVFLDETDTQIDDSVYHKVLRRLQDDDDSLRDDPKLLEIEKKSILKTDQKNAFSKDSDPHAGGGRNERLFPNPTQPRIGSDASRTDLTMDISTTMKDLIFDKIGSRDHTDATASISGINNSDLKQLYLKTNEIKKSSEKKGLGEPEWLRPYKSIITGLGLGGGVPDAGSVQVWGKGKLEN